MKRKFKIKIETSLNGNIWYYAMYRWNGIKYLFGWHSYLLNFKTEEEAIQQIKKWEKQDDINNCKGNISYKIVNLQPKQITINKTAMQELIDEVRKLRKNGFSVDDKYLQGLLEKEKLQMMDFYIGCSKDTREYNNLSLITEMWKAQRYYNETYNQNK